MLPIILKEDDNYRKFNYPDHLGVDLKGNIGEEVKAIGSGMVFFSGEVNGFGNFGKPGGVIVIRHKNKFEKPFFALYGHLKRKVFVGEMVSKDTIIGELTEYKYMDNGQIINAPHLHYGISISENIPEKPWGYDKDKRDFVDPTRYHKEFL